MACLQHGTHPLHQTPTRTVRSSDPEANKNSFGLNARAPTGPLCEVNVCSSFPAVKSQIYTRHKTIEVGRKHTTKHTQVPTFTQLSAPPDATQRPSGLNRRTLTALLWPLNVMNSCRLRTSHSWRHAHGRRQFGLTPPLKRAYLHVGIKRSTGYNVVERVDLDSRTVGPVAGQGATHCGARTTRQARQWAPRDRLWRQGMTYPWPWQAQISLSTPIVTRQ